MAEHFAKIGYRDKDGVRHEKELRSETKTTSELRKELDDMAEKKGYKISSHSQGTKY